MQNSNIYYTTEKYANLTDEYTKTKDYDIIHCYQLVRDTIDIFTQMTKGRKFDKNYLKDNIKW